MNENQKYLWKDIVVKLNDQEIPVKSITYPIQIDPLVLGEIDIEAIKTMMQTSISFEVDYILEPSKIQILLYDLVLAHQQGHIDQPIEVMQNLGFTVLECYPMSSVGPVVIIVKATDEDLPAFIRELHPK